MKKECMMRAFINVESSYDDNAYIQQYMSKKLFSMLEKYSLNTFDSIFEFGSGTGILTRLLSQLAFKRYICNDICNYKNKYTNSRIQTQIFDMEDICYMDIYNERFNLIASNACLQWLPFNKTIENLYNMLDSNGVLLIGTFGVQNLVEVRDISGVGLVYLSLDYISKYIGGLFEILQIDEEIKKLDFSHSLGVFRHLRDSGVNSLGDRLKTSWIKEYQEKYKGEISYHCIYILARKS